MVLAGGALAGIVFLALGCVSLDGTPVQLHWALLATLCCMFLIPTFPGLPTEVRGFGEFFPLNGPFWSLFYEYIGNILYALLLRRLSTKVLAVISFLSAAMVLQASVDCGYLGVGWSAADMGWWYGFVRMLFPYTLGMLMARVFRPIKVRNAFWWCSLLVLLVSFAPVLGGEANPWMNGLYDFIIVSTVFPLVVWTGASDSSAGKTTVRLSRTLGDLSYPLYAIHYPFMCILFIHMGFSGDLLDKSVVFASGNWQLALGIVLLCPILAHAIFRFYDKPVRGALSRKLNY
jgi:peptidoglycan/LPS O-acetylase OafA/YrhL